jgi:CBS domain-containing protein
MAPDTSKTLYPTLEGAPGVSGAAGIRKIKEVMTLLVQCANPEDPVQDVAIRMKNLDLGSFPVRDDQGRVVGMITDRDLVVRVLAEGRDPYTARARDVMSRDIIVIEEDSTVETAEELMKRHRIRRIPVVDREGRLTGYFSIGRLARTEDAAESRDVLKRVTEPPHAKAEH